MRSQLLTLTLTSLALAACNPMLAGEHERGKSIGHRSRAFCPHCGEACYPTVTKGKETKHCFDTESKTICIPKVRFPWEIGWGKGRGECVTPKCGRTKTVNVLIKHEYECTVCKYSWDPGSFKDEAKKNGLYLNAADDVGDPVAPAPPSVEARRPLPLTRVRR